MANKQIKDFIAKDPLSATDKLLIQESGGVTKYVTALNIASHGQLKFPATQNPSSNANTLDDYEEGSFFPIVEGSTAAGTCTYANQRGRYTKIGRICFFSIYLNVNTFTGTGNILIKNLPFSTESSSTLHALSVAAGALTFSGQLCALIETNANYINIESFATGGALTAVAVDAAFLINIEGFFEVA